MSRAPLLISFALIAGSFACAAADTEPTGIAFFESRVRPALVAHCYECHSGENAEADLRLDYRGGWQKGGKSGPAIIPGAPTRSPLIRAIRHATNSPKMPKGRPQLSYDLIVDFAEWIRIGAPDPRSDVPSANDSMDLAWQAKLADRSRWWSLTPLLRPEPPTLAGVTNSIDRFVIKHIQEAGLTNAPPAGPQILLRRLSFILTGLPPDPAAVDSFSTAWADNPDRAVNAAVDQLLDSPHFGERFARHWMDVVRYTDTYGYEWDNPAKGSWRYRDYLIRAFNGDIGFDQLLREQIAGDLLSQPRINRTDHLNESLIGPMFYHFGEHRHGDSLNFNGIHQEMVNNKIDAFSKAFLATTVACARCHDHKLEAVSQRDYYALASVFMSSRWTTRSVDSPARNAGAISRLKTLRREIRTELARLWQSRAQRFATELFTDTFINRFAKATPTAIGHPVYRLLSATDDEIPGRWDKLAAAWRKTRDSAVATNSKDFTVIEDFADAQPPTAWTTDGDGMRNAFVTNGAPLIALLGESAIGHLLPAGFHTHTLSSKLPGSLRTPRLANFRQPYLSLRLSGGEWAGHLTPVENAFQTERVKFFNNDQPGWTRFSTFNANSNWNIRTEIATADLNPNFPPRTGLARSGKVRLPNKDLGNPRRSWFSVTGIVTHDNAGTPKDTLDEFISLYAQPPPDSKSATISRLSEWMERAVDRWSTHQGSDAEVSLINWLLTNGALPNTTNSSPKLGRLITEYRNVENSITFPATVNSMDERALKPVSYPLNIRGNVDEVGKPVDRDFLQMFAGRNNVATSKGSGRLELAESLLQPDHPLTARVYVNRVWHWIFGTGLVSTPDDFGRLGDRPSHPELLDYLAAEFIRHDWSTKWLIRQLVTSRTFRQSGKSIPDAMVTDPDNRLWHHFPTRRLEAEAIRDAILKVSGRLDPRLYGRPLDPPRNREHAPKRLFSGPMDGDGRRSIYWRITMMELPAFLKTFNFPNPKLPNGKRDVTDVPAQALTLLNDPFVVAAAKHWAEQLVLDRERTPGPRIRRMFQRAFGRTPVPDERRRWQQAIAGFSTTGDLMADQSAWAQAAHTLFNTKEFIYYR